jgi:two-component system sensor histidine kinase TctE
MRPWTAEPRRPGIRLLLLALLLPSSVALLALDSWNDYRALSGVVQDAYDQALLEPVEALDDSAGLGPDGAVRVEAMFSVQAMFDVIRPRHKYLRVSVAPPPGVLPRPQGPGIAPQTLVGVADLPPAPEGPDGVPLFYDGVYRGDPVRIVALRRTISSTDPALSVRILSQAAESTGPRRQAQQDSLRQALWRDTRMIAMMVIVVWLGVALALRPLQRLRRSLRERSPDDLRPLDAGHVPHEVAPLVEAVNHHMADHQRMLAEQTRFLADASHQLRTPLAIMLTQAGYAVREPDPARMRESLRAIIAQLGRARRLSEQLLALAHARHAGDDGGAAAAPAVIDLHAVARAVVLQYLPLAHEKDLDLGWAGAADDDEAPQQPAPVAASEAELHEALANLVHNAIQYTPGGGSITVSVRSDGASVRAEVRDSGPGIPAERRAEVFERFHRGGTGAASPVKGAGLGLAIARAYARRHGGEIELSDAASGQPGTTGLCATLRLPRAADA